MTKNKSGITYNLFIPGMIAIIKGYIPAGSLAISSRDAKTELNNLKITHLPEP